VGRYLKLKNGYVGAAVSKKKEKKEKKKKKGKTRKWNRLAPIAGCYVNAAFII
jgi:hypothetical protein